MRKKHKDIFLNIGICYFLISLFLDHKFTGIAKQNWSEFISIQEFVSPFISMAYMVGLIAFIISYFAFYRAFRDETCNPNKLARIARFYYYTLLYTIFCVSIRFLFGTIFFFAYENYTLIDIVLSQSLFALIWIIILLFLLGFDREYIKAALAWYKLED